MGSPHSEAQAGNECSRQGLCLAARSPGSQACSKGKQGACDPAGKGCTSGMRLAGLVVTAQLPRIQTQ